MFVCLLSSAHLRPQARDLKPQDPETETLNPKDLKLPRALEPKNPQSPKIRKPQLQLLEVAGSSEHGQLPYRSSVAGRRPSAWAEFCAPSRRLPAPAADSMPAGGEEARALREAKGCLRLRCCSGLSVSDISSSIFPVLSWGRRIRRTVRQSC